jgi:uncharacterized membrane protein
MSWINIAVLAAATSAVVNIFDKRVIHGFASTPLTLPLLVGILQPLLGTGILLFVDNPDGFSFWPYASGFASGILFGLSGLIMIWTMFRNEVSRIVPIVQTFPVFTVLIAFVFLGEQLTVLQLLAILLAVLGGIVISMKYESGIREASLINKSLAPLILSSFLLSVAYVAQKLAVTSLPLLTAHGLRSLGLAPVFWVFAIRRESVEDVIRLIKGRTMALPLVIINELIIANCSLFLTVWAISLGPVSLVSAIISARSLFLLLYTTVLGLISREFLGEEISWISVLLKLVATIMIVSGIGILVISES